MVLADSSATQVFADRNAERGGYLRIADESGEERLTTEVASWYYPTDENHLAEAAG